MSESIEDSFKVSDNSSDIVYHNLNDAPLLNVKNGHYLFNSKKLQRMHVCLCVNVCFVDCEPWINIFNRLRIVFNLRCKPEARKSNFFSPQWNTKKRKKKHEEYWNKQITQKKRITCDLITLSDFHSIWKSANWTQNYRIDCTRFNLRKLKKEKSVKKIHRNYWHAIENCG